MNLEHNLDEHIKRTKKQAKWGCLTWFVILIVAPIVLIVGMFSYEMYFKERQLVTSYSPSEIHMIEVVEKGEAAWFGPSSVRIKYGWWKHVDRSISNDGKTLDFSNVSVTWKNDNEAVVTLYGEEQEPENVEITILKRK
ncbi:hypothetical protein [Metabacillus fastidiosus]|uniref:hypothetical protein n=1 Tax=Metabacillus fastidiosus TaxID=1458 RepID=UPI002DBDE946|nr:hypothetical protein [Metabacillus fastidiosus]MEC2074829.1 hypothetical protein [Metabacillus fastidiosus]